MSDEVPFVSRDDIATGRALPPGMVRDLRAIASADSTGIDKLSQALMEETGVPTEERIEEIARQYFNDGAAESIANTVRILNPESKQKIFAVVALWRQTSDENRQLMPDSEFEALQRNLDSLIQDYPGLELMRKAQRLLRETGNEFEAASFTCDLRPVFDSPQEHVEGFLTLATLRIQHVRQSGQREVFEIALTENELLTLVDRGKNALRKMEVLKETVRDLLP